MIRQTAPKDMTVTEFVNLVERRYAVGTGCNMDAWINTLRMIAEEPAPNPFTPDQLAWMRMSQEQFGFSYAAMFEETVYLFNGNPMKLIPQKWKEYSMCSVYAQKCFLRDFLPNDGLDCICFADYAPIEGEHKC